MNQMDKIALDAQINALRALVSSARGTAGIPALPNTPIVALSLICNALDSIVKTLEDIVKKV